MEDYTLIAAVVVGALLLVAVMWMMSGRRRRAHLQKRFGPEYEHAVGTAGSTAAAEAALLERERRVSKYKIRSLTADERTRYMELWQKVQAQFVDDPATAVVEADLLVTDLMSKRGYPMTDWDQRVDDLSVDHPNVVHHYREARDITRRRATGGASPDGTSAGGSTEDLRQALVHYRALFTDLLDDPVSTPARRTH